eukprot:SAG11_NODE_23187_length_393_cov_1.925170_1_plen_38_part_01
MMNETNETNETNEITHQPRILIEIALRLRVLNDIHPYF